MVKISVTYSLSLQPSLSIQCSGINYIHKVVQLSPLSICRTFHHPEQKLCTHPPLPQPLVTSLLLFISLNLHILDISWRQNHTGFVLLCLDYFTKHVFRAHPCCGLYQTFVPFYGRVPFHYMYASHFVNRFVRSWTQVAFPPLAAADSTAVNTGVQVSV